MDQLFTPREYPIPIDVESLQHSPNVCRQYHFGCQWCLESRQHKICDVVERDYPDRSICGLIENVEIQLNFPYFPTGHFPTWARSLQPSQLRKRTLGLLY
jgi:hypothetical protein